MLRTSKFFETEASVSGNETDCDAAENESELSKEEDMDGFLVDDDDVDSDGMRELDRRLYCGSSRALKRAPSGGSESPSKRKRTSCTVSHEDADADADADAAAEEAGLVETDENRQVTDEAGGGGLFVRQATTPPPDDNPQVDLIVAPETVYTLETFNSLAPHLLDLNHEIDTDILCDAVDELFTYWVIQPRPQLTISLAYQLFAIDRQTMYPDMKELSERFDMGMNYVLNLYARLQRARVLPPNPDPDALPHSRINRILGMMKQALTLVEQDQLSASLLDPTRAAEHTYEVWNLTNAQRQAFKPKQELVLFLLHRAFIKRYRKLGSDLYVQIMTPHDENGVSHCTHAWKFVMTITEFIYQTVEKERHLRIWNSFIDTRGASSFLEDYLINARDRELPVLKRSRYAQSHRNGIYMILQNQFLEYGKDAIPPDLVTAKYFDSDFPKEALLELRENPNNCTFRDIPTPKLDSILDAQQLPRWQPGDDDDLDSSYLADDGTLEHMDDQTASYFRATRFSVCDWFYALLGRLRYEVGARDKWQVIMFLKGVAQSGKSTIAQLIKMFFDSQDVGILSNNLERKFGLGAIYDKMVFMCLEVKRDFGVDQGEFQSMVSGEDMSIPVKFKTAENTRWSSHGILMGNELPEWTNNSGSIGRRVIVGAFMHAVRNANPTLLDELREELPFIMLKINAAYIHATRLFARKDIWDVLPQYFKDQRRLLRADTHLLDHFFQHGHVLLGEEYSTTLSNFRDHFKQHAQADRRPMPHWSPDFYRVTFEEYGVEMYTEKGDRGQTIFMLRGVAMAGEYNDAGSGSNDTSRESA